MRTRWVVDWRYVKVLAGVWFVVGLLGTLVGDFVWHSPRGGGMDWHSPEPWVLLGWLAPFAAAGVGRALLLLLAGLLELPGHIRKHPPVRRVTEPVTKDLREVSRGGE